MPDAGPYVMTYRGVRIRLVSKGLGQYAEYVSGVYQGTYLGGTAESRAETLCRWIDAAGERPSAYAECWHPKAAA